MKTLLLGRLGRLVGDLFPTPKDSVGGIESIPATLLRQYPEISRNLPRWVRERQYCNLFRNNDEMARSLGVDRKAMDSYFRHVIREDCRTWRIRLKIQEAQRLIRETDYQSIREISERVGFSDPSNFRKQFLRHAGCTPLEWAGKCGK